ncbi:MAG: fasciclin domain-containing protein [Bacteroidetes bacterium]|nr:fasciclin domain-containing protein [Bacteroidota bacterium]
MKNVSQISRLAYLVLLSGALFLTACNKDLEQPAAIPTPVYPTGSGVAATLAANANYSFYSALITRAGMTATLNDSTKSFTLFATDNAGMKIFVNAASGGAVPLNAPDATFLGFISGSLPAASAAGIVQYNTIGQKFTASTLSTGFPNYPLPSQIILDPTQPFVRMPIFPVRGTPYSYVNNLPITATDMVAANGVIHTAYSVAAPPSATLKTMVAGESTLSYFRAAITRADSGSTGLSKFDSLMNYGVTNMTVLAPNDAAFQTLIFGLVYSQVLAATGNATVATTQANAAVAAGPAFLAGPGVTTALVKGIVAYHFLATLTTSTTTPYQPNIRVFSNNVSATPVFIKTLVNSSVAAHPGVMAQATYTGPAVTALKFSSYGTFPPGGTPFSYTANVVTMDKHAVNGVYHIIDKVLLPQ